MARATHGRHVMQVHRTPCPTPQMALRSSVLRQNSLAESRLRSALPEKSNSSAIYTCTYVSAHSQLPSMRFLRHLHLVTHRLLWPVQLLGVSILLSWASLNIDSGALGFILGLRSRWGGGGGQGNRILESFRPTGATNPYFVLRPHSSITTQETCFLWCRKTPDMVLVV